MPSDNKKVPRQHAANSVMFAVYLLFLVWAILWKFRVPFIGGTERVINLIPFSGNAGYEKLFNLVLFVPLGFYAAAIAKKHGVIKQILTVLAVSLVFEILQYTLAIGSSDTTDLMLNTLGGASGIVGFFLLKKLSGKHTNKVVLIAGGLITTVVLYCSVSFMVFGMLYIGRMMFRL
ncbi:VanZ family protein [Sporolactobacillus vineae]|jgi:glycopeptide antibiotics resistance protein|uniref:VanZ family protein n=1 Tax=Sporolactobacillus vineae TaxID=444463 RepID=UPI000289A0C1|nr:VanZ family protein [Sporolactobacillus vineae]